MAFTTADLIHHLRREHGEDAESLLGWISDRSTPGTGEACYPDNTPAQHLADLHLFQHDNEDNDLGHVHAEPLDPEPVYAYQNRHNHTRVRIIGSPLHDKGLYAHRPGHPEDVQTQTYVAVAGGIPDETCRTFMPGFWIPCADYVTGPVCVECGEPVELCDPDDDESWIHAEGQPADGHTAERAA